MGKRFKIGDLVKHRTCGPTPWFGRVLGFKRTLNRRCVVEVEWVVGPRTGGIFTSHRSCFEPAREDELVAYLLS